MPTIEVSHSDLCKLIGKQISLKELKEEGILFAKGEIDEESGDQVKVDIKDTNRPDLWSAEGIARELRGHYGIDKGLPKYEIKKSGLVVHVDKRMSGIRPYTVCAVVKNLEITDDVLSQMIQLQEKISITYGRNRKEVAIGVYDFHKIKPPIRFVPVKPTGIRFAPLEFREKMTPKEILEKHPKGIEYGHLLDGLKEYPLFVDANNEVLSMPPIINSNHTGKVTNETRDVFIECSGFNVKFLIPALNVLVAALADRGGDVQSVDVVYDKETINTPDMKPKGISIDVDYCNRVSGLGMKSEEICKLLEQSRYGIKKDRKSVIELLYPAYRQDVMHQRDVIEDVIISYGYNRIEPEVPRLSTVGGSSGLESFSEKAAQLMTGLGLQEIMSYMLTNRENIFRKMNVPHEPVAEIENIVSSNWCVFRNWLLPSCLEFISNNKHREYPQRIFELGDTVELGNTETGTKDVRKLCAVITNTKVGYEEIASILDAFMENIGAKYTLRRSRHGSFVPGRCAEIVFSGRKIGFMGEVHPQVLENWELEKPVIAFELDVQEIFESLS
jgi:phenylalanyl-tRNA synthetase beta chain